MEEKQKKNKSSVRKTSNTKSNIGVSDHGRLYPQALDLEEVVLGALLLEQNALNEVIDFLRTDVFYKESHRFIFEAIHELFGESLPVDMLTVTDRLKSKGQLELVGGAHYIAYLTNRVVSAANIEYHARIITQKFIQRKLIDISSEIINEAFEDSTDVFNLLDEAEKKLFSINEDNLRREVQGMSALLSKAKEQIEKSSAQEGGFSGVPSGFKELDRITAGWQPSDLIIIAARPGMGKTAFVLSMARNMAVDKEKPVAVFSLEMSAIQLVMRLISSESKISSENLRRGDLSPTQWKSLNDNMETLTTAPLFIDDTPALNIFELRTKARRLKQQHDIQCIIIDYMQLMNVRPANDRGGSNTNREQEISTISRSIKALAKELEIPIIALSQLSRAVETRGGSKRPILSDLRESGAIEQDADMVLFIYREEYYFKDDPKFDIEPIKDKAELIIAKHRNGSLDTIDLRFISHYAKFEDPDAASFDDFTRSINAGEYNGDSVITKQSKMNDESSDDLEPKAPGF